MTTISEAQQQISQQLSQISQAQLQSQQQLRNIELAQSKIPEYTSQKALRQTYAGTTGQVKRSMFQRLKESLFGQKQQVKQYQQQLQSYEQQVLNPYEQQLQEAVIQQQVQQQAQAKAAAYNYALRVYLGKESGKNIGSVPINIRKQAQAQAEKIESASYISALNQFGSEQGLKPVIVGGQITGFEDTVKQMSVPIPNIQNLSQQDLARYEQAGIQVQTITPEISYKELSATQISPVLSQSKVLDTNHFVANLIKQTGVSTKGELGYSTFVQPVLDRQQMSRIEQPKDLYLSDSLQSYDTSGISNLQSRKGGGFLGFSSVGNWISNNIIGSPKSYFEKGIKEESYSSGLGAFVSASPTGPSATAYIRQPSEEEQRIIDQAQIKGSFSEFPLIKFVRGGYEWQKKAETEFEKKFEKNKVDIWFEGLPKQDIKEVTYSPQGFTPTLTDVFFKGIDQITSGLSFLGVDTSKKINIPKQTARDIALIGSLSIFDPLMRVGAVAKKKTVSQQLSENKFAGLGEELNVESISKINEFYQRVRQEIIKKQAGEAQLKTLNEIYKKFFKGKPFGKEDFKVLVQSLYNQGDFKGVPLEYLSKPKEQQMTIVLDIQGLPEMRGSSVITSNLGLTQREGINVFSVMPEEKQQVSTLLGSSNFDVLWEEPKQTTRVKQISMLGLKEFLQTKPKSEQKLSNLQLSSLAQLELTRQKSGQATKTALLSSLGLRQAQSQRYKTQQVATQGYPKPIEKQFPRRTIKFPFGFPSQETKKKKLLGKEFGEFPKGAFDIYTRVRGKEKLIASRVTERAALDIGAATTLFGIGKASALSASIILKPTKGPARNIQTRGEFAKVKDIFRIGKVKGKGASLTLVQKETKRLGTFKERRAIIKSRKGGLFSLK